MRRLIVFLLLLPLPVVSQVKILMPVLVKDAAGKPVTDLKVSDFEVSGPRNIRVQDMSLVEPQTVTKDDPRASVVVVYDAVNIPTSFFEANVRELRDFLREVANRRLPVTLLVNTEAGLRLVYNVRTPPEVLSAALAATSGSKPKSTDVAVPITDPKVEEQIKNLQLLNTAVHISRSRLDAGVDQMKSLIALAHLLQQLPGRKALVWVAITSPVLATQDPAYWNSPAVPGVAIYAGAPPLQSSGAPADKSLLPMYEGMVEELNTAHVSVYPMLYGQGNPVGVGYVWDSWKGFQQLAESTGGLLFRLGQQTSILAAVDAAAADFGPYYMLAVEVPTPKELDWIPVKIKVKRPGLTVRAAPGFLGLRPVKTH